jgi:type IV secretory pathway VirJ component
MSLEQDLLEIERHFWTDGPAAYLQHTDDECLVVFADMAKLMNKADIAKTARQGRWRDVQLQPKGSTRLSATSAVVAYECTAKREDGEPYHALVSSGYVKRPNGWKLAFHQQTPAG